MVTHDPSAAAVADRVVFLRDGRVAGEVAGRLDASASSSSSRRSSRAEIRAIAGGWR